MMIDLHFENRVCVQALMIVHESTPFISHSLGLNEVVLILSLFALKELEHGHDH